MNEALSAIVAPLLDWYDSAARTLPWRENTQPYRVWVSEIMLQQTRVEAVKPYFERFLARLPTMGDLADAPEEELLKLWEGLGYYARARNLQRAARLICGEYGGVFPDTLDGLLSLPGVGGYTAGAIASISFGLPAPAVDGNVLRVVSRLTENDTEIGEGAYKARVAGELAAVYPPGRCGDFTQSLMELGALVCTPGGVPKCGECPLSPFCGAFRHGTQTHFPVKNKKPPRRSETKTVLLLCHDGRVAVRKRDGAGLLRGMWEFPNLPGRLTQAEAADCLREFGVSAESIAPAMAGEHIFTHVQWSMTSFLVHCAEERGDFLWADAGMLEREVALPTAFRKFCAALPFAL